MAVRATMRMPQGASRKTEQGDVRLAGPLLRLLPYDPSLHQWKMDICMYGWIDVWMMDG